MLGGSPGDRPTGTVASEPSAPQPNASTDSQPGALPERDGRPTVPDQSGQPSGQAAEFAYQPLWPFAGQADAAKWQRSYRSGGHQPWHLDAGATARSFTVGYLGYSRVDRVVSSTVRGQEAHVAVGFRLPNGRLATAAVIHLVRLGDGADAPWEVVGTHDTTLSLTTPRYGARVSSPVVVGGRITGVDESVSVQLRALGQDGPVGRLPAVAAGGRNTPWSVRVPFQAPAGAVLTVAAATGGHVAAVERFSVTGAVVAKGSPTAAIDGDVDGDGRVDSVSFLRQGILRIRYATGATDTVSFDAPLASPEVPVRLLGIVDADRDGRAEVFVRTGAGAYTQLATVFRYVDGHLRLVILDGHQSELRYGGSVRNSESWTCRPPAAPIVQWSGESNDGSTFTGTLSSYRLVGATLELVRTSQVSLTPDRLPEAGCGSIKLT
jgi:hypothetical protein